MPDATPIQGANPAGHAAGAPTASQDSWSSRASFEEDPVVAQPGLYLGGAFAGGLALGALLRWLRG